MLSRILLFSVFSIFCINLSFAQNCVFSYFVGPGDPDNTPYFCFADPNLQSGDQISMTCSQFYDDNYINGLIITGSNLPNYDFCDDAEIIIIERQFAFRNDDPVEKRGGNNCTQQIVFRGETPQVNGATPCENELVLNINLTSDITPDFIPPPTEIVANGYDVIGDPDDVLGVPTNATAGEFSYAIVIGSAEGEEPKFYIRTITLETCCASISKQQTIIEISDCGYLTDAIIDNNPIDEATYEGKTKISSVGTVATGTDVKFYAGQSVELNAGFTVEAGATFTAEILPCAFLQENIVCTDAKTLVCGQMVIGQNVSDTAIPSLNNSCTVQGSSTSMGDINEGLFYRFVGDGGYVTISTDFAVTDFDTELRVFSGGCGNLICEVGSDD
ncbi:MAG: 3-coathanger stack domain-containing protein, partial [Saprospiraceae bacterium]